MKGNIHCTDLLDIRSESWIQGEIITKRIHIDDGAVPKGSVEIRAFAKSTPAEQPLAKPAAVATEAAKLATVPATLPPPAPAGPESVKRVPGSSVLFKPV